MGDGTKEPEIALKRDGSGRLYVRPYLGRSKVTGRPWRPMHYLKATDEAEAMEEARWWLSELLGNRRLGPALSSYVDRCGKSANSIRSWRAIASNYVSPYLGATFVRDVETRDLMDLYAHLLEHGGRDGGPLSASTVLGVHWFLRRAFKWFRKMDWCDGNPAMDADKPSPAMAEAEPLEEWDVVALEERAHDVLVHGEMDDLWIAMLGAEIALRAGLRAGEVCALRRRDVRLVTHDLHVAGTVVECGDGPCRKDGTKGGGSRTVAMDGRLEAMVKLAIARLDHDMGGVPDPGSPLLTRGSGFVSPSAMARTFSAECRRLGLPAGTHFHTLRHTHASLLIAAGVDVRTVAERLGHKGTFTTLKYYAHLLPGRDQEAAEAFARAVEQVAGAPGYGRDK